MRQTVNWSKSRQKDRQTDRQAGRQTDKQTIILQRCNVRVILHKLTRVFPGEEDENIHTIETTKVVCIKLKLN